MDTLANNVAIMESKVEDSAVEQFDESLPTREDSRLPGGSENSSIRSNRAKRRRPSTDLGEQRASKRSRKGIEKDSVKVEVFTDEHIDESEEELSEDYPANPDDKSTMEDALSIYHQPPYKPLGKYDIRKLYSAVKDQAQSLRVSRIESQKVLTIDFGSDTYTDALLALGKIDEDIVSGALDQEILTIDYCQDSKLFEDTRNEVIDWELISKTAPFEVAHEPQDLQRQWRELRNPSDKLIEAIIQSKMTSWQRKRNEAERMSKEAVHSSKSYEAQVEKYNALIENGSDSVDLSLMAVLNDEDINWESIMRSFSMYFDSVMDVKRFWIHFACPNMKRGKFPAVETNKLKAILQTEDGHQLLQDKNWEGLALMLAQETEELNGGQVIQRTPWDIHSQYMLRISEKHREFRWTRDEEAKLLECAKKYSTQGENGKRRTIDWPPFLANFPLRSKSQIQAHWRRIDPEQEEIRQAKRRRIPTDPSEQPATKRIRKGPYKKCHLHEK